MGAHCGSKSNNLSDRSKHKCKPSGGPEGKEKGNTVPKTGAPNSSNELRHSRLVTNPQTQNQQPLEQSQSNESLDKDSRSKHKCKPSEGPEGKEKGNTEPKTGGPNSSNERRHTKLITNPQTQKQQPVEQSLSNESLYEDSSGGAADQCPQGLGETDHISSVKVPGDKAEKKTVDSHPAAEKEKVDAGADLKDGHPRKHKSGPTAKTTGDECEKNAVGSHRVLLKEKSEAGATELKNDHSQGINRDHEGETVELQKITKIDQMRVIYKKFDKIDKNGDGRLSKEEFVSSLKETNTSDLDPEDFSEIANGKDFITRQDFAEFYIRKTWNAIISDFLEMDTNGEQKISKEVFVDYCKSKQNLCSESQAEWLFKKLDENDDNELSFKEFKDGMEQQYIVSTLEEFFDFGDVKEIRNQEKGTHQLLFPPCCPPEKVAKFHIVYENGLAKLRNSTVKEAFNQIDWETKDQEITITELTKYFGQQGASKTDCKKLFDNLDQNGDGVVDYTEFENYFLRTAMQL